MGLEHRRRGWRSLVSALRDPARSDFAFVPHQYVHAPSELVDVALSPGESTPINARKPAVEHARNSQLNRYFVFHVLAISCAAVCCAWLALFPLSAARLYDMQVDVFNTNHAHATFFLRECLGLGYIFGAAAAGYLGDRLGRAGALELSAIPYIVGWLLVALAYGEVTVVVGRYLLGIAAGMMRVVAPIYLAEISAARTRGRMLCVLALVAALARLSYVALGALVLELSRTYDGFNVHEWKALAVAALVPGLVLLLAMQRLPDSPTWLVVHHNDRERAFAVLAQLFSRRYKSAEYHVNAVIHANELATHDRTYRSAFFRPLLLCGALSTLRAVSSTLLAPTLSSAPVTSPRAFVVTVLGVRLDGSDTDLLAVMAALWLAAALGVVCCLLLIDARGRQFALQSGCAIVAAGCVCLLSSVVRSSAHVDGPLVDYGSATVLLMVAGHALGLGVVPIVVASELFPAKQRVGAMSIVVIWESLVVLGVSALALPFVRATLHHSLHVLGVCAAAVLFCSVAGVALASFYVPETSVRSLQEIEAIFSGWQPATPQRGFSRVRLSQRRHYGTSPTSDAV